MNPLDIPLQYFIEDDFDRGGRIRIYKLCEMIRKANERN